MDKQLEYQIKTIESVKKEKNGYEIHMVEGMCFFLGSEHNVVPKKGDTVEIYGGIGRQIRGICIDGKTAFFKGDQQVEKERQEWLTETNKGYEDDYKRLMKETKNDPVFETADVTGFGGGYEYAVQKMIMAGVAFVNTKKLDPKFSQYENIYGVVASENEDCKELEKEMLKVNDGSSGAQMQCALNHVAYIIANGRAKWLNSFPADRKYIFPTELKMHQL